MNDCLPIYTRKLSIAKPVLIAERISCWSIELLHMCFPRGRGGIVVFLLFHLFRLRCASNKRWQLCARCSACLSSLVSNIIYHQFPFFKFHCECTHTHTQPERERVGKNNAEFWLNCSKTEPGRGFSVLLPLCREQINCVVSCRRLCCMWMMTMGCRSCRCHAGSEPEPYSPQPTCFSSIISIQ